MRWEEKLGNRACLPGWGCEWATVSEAYGRVPAGQQQSGYP